jgi:hypothetical protein
MKLFAWQPKGFGELSFFVCAETREEARMAIEKRIEELKKEEPDYEFRFNKWGTDYYILTIAERGEVVTNYNE